jgi:hypothetical protein
MRTSAGILSLAFLALLSLSPAWPLDSGSARIAGHVQLGPTTAPLVARLYAPKKQPQEGAGEAKGDVRRVRLAYISADGDFEFPDLRPGSYLLEIYIGDRLLYQKVVSTQDPQPLEIALSVNPCSLVYRKAGWRPVDLTSDQTSGVFVLDSAGAVSKLTCDQTTTRIDRVFVLPGAYQGVSVAASAQWVYADANSAVGCSVFRYSLADKSMAQRSMGVNAICGGIAANGTAVYVTMPHENTIRYLTSWDNSEFQSWAVAGADGLGAITFDRIGDRLIAADHVGKAFAIVISNGAVEPLGSNLGWVHGIAASQQHILLASGKKVLSLARSDNRGENPPLSLQSLTGGLIAGVAVDGGDRAWFADHDKQLVEGPLPLN